MKHKEKILVGMSGGVDSSVAAALLVQQGYDVTGAYMVNFDAKQDDEYGDPSLNLDCWRTDYRDAVRVAAHLGIQLIRLDFVEEYRSFVLDHMMKEYESGRTPNPDVMCNATVKFDAWVKKAKELGFTALATGHYATRVEKKGQVELRKAVDDNKDQTYFLHQLNQEQLQFARFPLGAYTKDQVRKLAKKFDLPTADKAESMGVCFVGEVPMSDFLKQKIKQTPGDIVHIETGAVLGQHDGLAFYTIGQRHGFSQPGGGAPLFVIKKDGDNNQLIVGSEDHPALYTAEISVDTMHWISGQAPELPLQCQVRFRHRQELQSCQIEIDGTTIVCDEPQRAITPGQFAVLYHGDVCLGGGVISE